VGGGSDRLPPGTGERTVKLAPPRPPIHVALADGFGTFDHFTTDADFSSPANSSPFITNRNKFAAWSARWPRRRALFQALEGRLQEARSAGVEIVCAMIGGSFLDADNPAPKDIDAVAFYRLRGGAEVDAAALKALERSAKSDDVDMRFIPADGSPLVLIKCAAFFALLYARGRHRGPRQMDLRSPRGTVLIDWAEEESNSASATGAVAAQTGANRSVSKRHIKGK
jgi:hypothetical protein